MAVDRISERALRKLLKERIEDDALCVVKFYSNTCDYCSALHGSYVDISDEYDDGGGVHFFAFNIADTENLDEIIKLNGVPTILSVKTGLLKPRIRVLEDPSTPHKQMWYHTTDIRNFIEGQK